VFAIVASVVVFLLLFIYFVWLAFVVVIFVFVTLFFNSVLPTIPEIERHKVKPSAQPSWTSLEHHPHE